MKSRLSLDDGPPVVAALQRGGDPECLNAILASPFAPGQSPFKIKGNAYRGQHAFVEEFHGDVAVFAEELGQRTVPPWGEFYTQAFLANRQYDVLPLVVAGIFAAEKARQPYAEWASERARRQATVDKGGVYRMLLRMAPPRTLVTRIPKIFANYINFGQVRSMAVDDGVHAQFLGVPALIEPWFSAIIGAYMHAVMELSRVEGIRVQMDTKSTPGLSHGMALCTVSAKVTWRHWEWTLG